MRVFPEDDWISVSKLIKLWICEGFLKPIRGKSLEEVAKEYLKDLIDRNLILIRDWTRSGRIKACGIHDILRELCVRESEREDLICVPKAQKIHILVLMEDYACFLCGHWLNRHNKIHLQEVGVGSQSKIVVSPSICEACGNMYQDLNKLRWVKVFKSAHDEFHVASLLHTKLRYLYIDGYERIKEDRKLIVPGTISIVWNLQILDLNHLDTTTLSEVWEMPKLRHLSVYKGRLLDPVEGQDSTILEDLSTLGIGVFVVAKRLLKEFQI
ncbi:UNVERIFIED_CONTAM: putative late blight resistance proteinR1B-16 [Sesamum angustifolium]|uniref:Late blight resistance proteinR1B-16 n=1 Tax=Sesamum angustifolium TaxID=2727405 RepID=A0AAW2IWN3_9LAMI